MKKLLLALFILICFAAYSQWQPNPYTSGNIYFNSGLVGIGTSDPQGYLHINPVRPIIIKNNGGNGVYGSEIGFNAVLNTSVVPNTFRKLGGTSQYGGASIAVDYRGNMLFQMYDANAETESTIPYSSQIAFLNNGFVGIGTTSPQAPLDVKGRQFYLGTIPITMGYSSTEYPSIGYNTTYTMTGFSYQYKGNDNASLIYFGQGGFSFKTAPVGSAGANIPFTEAMTIKQNGNVGIGTTSPNGKFHLVHSANQAYNNAFNITSNNPQDHWPLVISTNNKSNWSGFVNSNDDLSIYLRKDDGTITSVINSDGTSFLNGGNVGIGTTSPDAKLAVNGTIHAKEVKVDLTGWSDFVFGPNYKLRSLEEIDSYIKANKHLPDVPSAQEVETNGVNLGDMNKILLQKIEELTLYILNQEKRISELEKLNNNK